MPQPGQKCLTFKAAFIEGIEAFREKHPELGFASNPEFVRHACNNFIVGYEKEMGERK